MILKSLLVLLIVHKLRAIKAEGCGPPPLVKHTIPIKGTYALNISLRYKCEPGFTRKAGTSPKITCIKNETGYKWKPALPLECIADPKVTDVSLKPTYKQQSKTSMEPSLPTIEQKTIHVSRSTTRATSPSITTSTTTVTTTTAPAAATTSTSATPTATWKQEEATGSSVKPPSTVSYGQLSLSPSHSNPLVTGSQSPFSYQPAIVSGSVVAALFLMIGLLFFLFTKKALPCCQRHEDTRVTYHAVPIVTSP